jgi:predicted nuclease with TOPRIM domain
MAQTLESLIEKEHETVQKEREDLLAKRAEIDEQLRALAIRLEAATNYKATLEGKFARAPRGAGAELQKRILAIVKQFPKGASAEVINSELEATDAEAKKPIAAALFRMKKNKVLLQPKARGPYLIPTPTREVFEPPAGDAA